MDLNLFFRKLAATLPLGNLLSKAVRVDGGFMHTMYQLNTVSGTYAVKLLNPNIMKRPEAMGNYTKADKLEIILQNCNIPIIPSLLFGGEKMQQLDGQYFYVYEWFNGNALKSTDIKTLHCQKIGATLFQIHHLDLKSKQYQRNAINIDWNYYIALAKEQSSRLFELLDAHKELLYESQNKANTAIHTIPNVVAICHNDMDSKNVLWMNDDFRLIDLECLCYANPYLELFELALCWSGYENCSIDFGLFRVFFGAYFGNNPKPHIHWESIYDSNCGRLEWLEYNLKRALLIECSTIEEQGLGIEQVKQTLNHIIYYKNIKDEILVCLRELYSNEPNLQK